MATKAERDHMGAVAALGCVVCRNLGFVDSPAEIHHVRTGQGMGQRASNYEVIPLCPFITGWVDMATQSIPAANRGNLNLGKS